MTTQLPRRPFAALPPPPDGLSEVRHEARRRRRHRATVVAAGGAGVAAVATVVALSTAAGGVAVLRPDVPASGGISTVPSPAQRTAHHVHEAQTHRAGGKTSSHNARKPQAPLVIDRGPVVTPAGGDSGRRPGRSDQPAEPQLVRYRSTHSKATVGKGAELCGENVGYGPRAGGGVGWCFTSTARAVTNGVQLTVQICRDDTTGGTLDYGSAREVDIAVERGGKTVWDWGRDHPDQVGKHQLPVPTAGCWNWSLVWSGNTDAGGVAAHGTYSFVGTSTASELAGYPPRTVEFSY